MTWVEKVRQRDIPINYNRRLATADHLVFILVLPGVVYVQHPRGFGLVPLLENLKGVAMITTINKPKITWGIVSKP
jgi:hypothetical protein